MTPRLAEALEHLRQARDLIAAEVDDGDGAELRRAEAAVDLAITAVELVGRGGE